VSRVRVVRVRDVYTVEIHTRDGVASARVDGAGERVDDSIRARLEQHVPTWALFALLTAFAACGVLLGDALAPLGSLRASSASETRARRSALARSRLLGLILAPISLLALIGGAISIGWL
jgi:hypothetical protein